MSKNAWRLLGASRVRGSNYQIALDNALGAILREQLLPLKLVYAVIGPDSGWTDPTAAEVIAGRLAGGGAATWAGNYIAPSADGTYDWPSVATGLAAGTTYRVAVVWTDGVTTSNVGVGSFTTTAGAGFKAAWARHSNAVIQGGAVHA